MQLLCFISLCFYSLSVNTGHVCVSSQSGEQRNALCITVTQQLMVVQWSSFTWEWKQVWHFREVAATKNISNPIYHIISITTAVRRFSNTYIYPLFSYLSNHHPAHSCTPWADMFHISVGHARQPTQRDSLLALQIRAERAVIAAGGTEREMEKSCFVLDFPFQTQRDSSCVHHWIQHSHNSGSEWWTFRPTQRKAVVMQISGFREQWCCCCVVSERPFTS